MRSKRDANRRKFDIFLVLALLIIAAGIAFIRPSIIGFTTYSTMDIQPISPTAFTDNNAIGTNPANAFDNNFATFAAFDLGTGASPGTLDYYNYTNSRTEQINSVNVTFDLVVAGTSNDMWGLQYSDNAGTNWYDLRTLATGDQIRTNLTYIVTEQSAGEDGTWNFTEIQNDLRIKIQTDRIGGADGGTFYIYETWADVDYTVADTTPPSSITNLQNQSKDQTWIYWNWTNPADADFNSSIIYIDGTWQTNTTDNFYNATGLTCGTSYTITVHTKDHTGNVNDTDVNNTASTDICPDLISPSISSIIPYNNSVDIDGNIYFNCTASDDTDLENISLYVNGALNQTILITGTSYNANFTLLNLADNSYNWYCKVYDWYGNQNTTETIFFKVNSTATPLYSNFSGNTTDWNNVPDITNVSNAVIDVPLTGKIRWYNSVNAEGADFDSNIIISYNYIEVLPGLHSSFNSSAELTIRNLTYDAPPLILKDGILCNDTCSNVSYNSGTAVFNVTHFTNFTAIGNAQLGIWDETDPDKDNLTKYPNQQIKFYANYTKKSNNQPVLGAACTIDFADSAGNTMTYNATSTLYTYNRSFTTAGIKDYNITCTAAGSQTITLSDSANVSVDNTDPITILNTPLDNYVNDSASLINITFNCSATDNIELANISLYITDPNNSSFTLNQTTSLSGTSDSAQWILILGNGNYTWNCLSYDSSGNSDWGDNNRSIKINYTAPPLDNPPYWSNNQSNIVTTYSPTTQSYFNITWQDDNNVSSVWFESNYSGSPINYSMNNPAGDIYSYSAILPAGNHYWKSYANDTADQFNNTDTWPFTINKATTILTLTASPSWIINNNTQSNISCSVNNNEISYNLYRNGSLVSNPDIQTLSTGSYNYTCNTTGSQNYTSASESNILTVTVKSASFCSLVLSPTSPQIYPVNTTANCSCTNPEASAYLYRNNINVTNEIGLPVILPAGTYQYTCNVSETANYLSASNSSTYQITSVTPAPSGGGGGGTRRKIICQEAWQCNDWETCLENRTQYRICTDLNNCEERYNKKLVDELIKISKPEETRACRYESCTDKIKNQDEIGIDCGGICKPCPEIEPEPPTKEKPKIIITTRKGLVQKIQENIKIIGAVSIALALIIVIYLNYLASKIETINILENVAKKKSYGNKTTKDYIKKIIKEDKKRLMKFFKKRKKKI